MRRLLALGLALLALIGAGFFWTRDRPVAVATEATVPPLEAEDDDVALVAPVSSVTPQQREQRRFGRVDGNNDQRISRDEYLANRRKAFAKLDRDGDGRLGLEEYAVATVKKFSKADRDGDGNLNDREFAITAAKRSIKPACNCASPAEN